MTSPLRGRACQWSQVVDALAAAQGGDSGMLLVEGGMGAGKSRLLAEAAVMATSRDFAVAVCDAQDASVVPLGSLWSALGGPPGPLEAAVDPTEAADARAWVVEQLWLVGQLPALLSARAAQAPLLVALDHVEAADPATLLALRTLPPQVVSPPVLWMLARRREEGGGPLDRLFSMLEDDGATRIEVGPLAGDAVAEIVTDVLGAAPDPGLLALAAEADGNPYLVVELAEGLRDEGGVDIRDGRAQLRSGRLPGRVSRHVLGRLEAVSSDTRHLLEVAALLELRFSVDDAAGVLDEPPSRLLAAFEEALAADLLVSSGEKLAFRSGLCRRAVAEAIAGPVRRALQRQVDGLLPALPLLPAPDATPAPLAPARMFDPVAGAVRAVEAAVAAGHLGEAAALARSALAEHPPAGPAAELRAALSSTLLLAGRASSAVRAAEAGLAESDLRPDLVARLETFRLWGLAALGDLVRAREGAERIVAGESDTTGSGAQFILGLAAWGEGRLVEGLGLVRAATATARPRTGTWDSPPGLAHPSGWLAVMLANVGNFNESDTATRAAAEESARFGNPVHAAMAAIARARAELYADRLEAAAMAAEAGLAAAHELGAYLLVPAARCILASVALRRGELAAARDHVERYQAQLFADPVTFGSARYAWIEAQLADVEDGPEAAIDVLAGIYDGLPDRRRLLVEEPAAAPWMVRAALSAGDRGRAEVAAAAVRQLAADNPGFPALEAAAAHARGVLEGDPAILLGAARGHRHAWARASAAEDAGVLLAANGSRHRARGPFEAAIVGYQAAGAGHDAGRVRSRLRDIGVRRRHGKVVERPVCGWASLTDTERMVAEVVSEGLTNRKVAERLFLSPHTVDFHLRQIFRKLDIRSRVELTRIVLERDDEDQDRIPVPIDVRFVRQKTPVAG